MLKIDGSIGHGQVLRTAIALSSLLLKPVKIINIRINRPKPGLRPQHLMGVRIAAEFTAAKLKGAKVGSKEVEFVPTRHNIPSYKKIDIGTAGSVTLLLQTILPLILLSDKEIKLEIVGGTDVPGAPTTIYIQHILSYYLERMGSRVRFSTINHGFYPKGGGRFIVEVKPSKLKSLEVVERGKLKFVNLWSIASLNLQKARVAERQIEGFKESFKKKAEINGYHQYVNSLSPGTSLNAHAIFENCVLGQDGLGKKGLRAEEVGKTLAENLNKSIESEACLDKFMSDQILPFVVLAKGKSVFKVEAFTKHFLTNKDIIEKLIDVKFKIDEKEKIVKVDGIGFSGV